MITESSEDTNTAHISVNKYEAESTQENRTEGLKSGEDFCRVAL